MLRSYGYFHPSGVRHISDPFESLKDPSRRLQPKADDRPERQVDLEKAIAEAKESEA